MKVILVTPEAEIVSVGDILTEDVVKDTEECDFDPTACSGDSGELKCLFCSGCVLSLEERVYNVR